MPRSLPSYLLVLILDAHLRAACSLPGPHDAVDWRVAMLWCFSVSAVHREVFGGPSSALAVVDVFRTPVWPGQSFAVPEGSTCVSLCISTTFLTRLLVSTSERCCRDRGLLFELYIPAYSRPHLRLRVTRALMRVTALDGTFDSSACLTRCSRSGGCELPRVRGCRL